MRVLRRQAATRCVLQRRPLRGVPRSAPRPPRRGRRGEGDCPGTRRRQQLRDGAESCVRLPDVSRPASPPRRPRAAGEAMKPWEETWTAAVSATVYRRLPDEDVEEEIGRFLPYHGEHTDPAV